MSNTAAYPAAQAGTSAGMPDHRSVTKQTFSMGRLLNLQQPSDDPMDDRAVSFRFIDGVSGELKVVSGSRLIEGEVYLLAAEPYDRRIEITKAAERRLPDGTESWTEYLFRLPSTAAYPSASNDAEQRH